MIKVFKDNREYIYLTSSNRFDAVKIKEEGFIDMIIPVAKPFFSETDNNYKYDAIGQAQRKVNDLDRQKQISPSLENTDFGITKNWLHDTN